MKKLMIITLMAVAALTASAQRRSNTTRRAAVGADGGAAVAQGKDAKVQITRKASIGSASLQSAPSVGASYLGKVFKKPRQWIVPELEYQTFVDWQDELTLTWHILLDSEKAKQRDKPSKDKEPVPQFSYYTASVRYLNVPKGSHAASVVLPPAILERYGEPVVISVRITNKEGDTLEGQDVGTDTLRLPDDWWNSEEVFAAKKNGVIRIARRQGLVDRSKTIFALVDPNNFEMVQQ